MNSIGYAEGMVSSVSTLYERKHSRQISVSVVGGGTSKNLKDIKKALAKEQPAQANARKPILSEAMRRLTAVLDMLNEPLDRICWAIPVPVVRNGARGRIFGPSPRGGSANGVPKDVRKPTSRR